MESLSFGSTLKGAITRMEQRIERVQKLEPVMDRWSRHMLRNSIPETFATAGRGTWPRVRRYGQFAPFPLVDTGKLLKGITRAWGMTTALIVTAPDAVQARLMHFGGEVHAIDKFMAYGGPWMAIPLSAEAARRGTRGYLGQSNVFIVGPGRRSIGFPGIYRRLRGGHLQMLFLFRKSVRHPAFPFMKIWPDDREVAVALSASHIMLRKAA